MDPTKGITTLLDSLDFFDLTDLSFFLFGKKISEIICQFKTLVSVEEFQVSKGNIIHPLSSCPFVVFQRLNQYRFAINLLFWQSKMIKGVSY